MPEAANHMGAAVVLLLKASTAIQRAQTHSTDPLFRQENEAILKELERLVSLVRANREVAKGL